VFLAFAVVIGVALDRGACAQSAEGPQIASSATDVPFTAFIAEASQRFGIPAAWIRAVMRAESFGDMRAISPKGAIGLMQITPETWAELRERYHLGADPFDAHDNIVAGAAYLRELRDRYGIPGFLAAYNAGPARWEDHLATGRPLPAETRTYLARLAPLVGNGAGDDAVVASIMRSWTEASLFPSRLGGSMKGHQAASNPQPSRPTNEQSVKDWTGLAPQSDGLFVALSSTGRSP
jgi:soluble lytic murein transglycosylase-like protein